MKNPIVQTLKVRYRLEFENHFNTLSKKNEKVQEYRQPIRPKKKLLLDQNQDQDLQP
jgi:hypothetical protein